MGTVTSTTVAESLIHTKIRETPDTRHPRPYVGDWKTWIFTVRDRQLVHARKSNPSALVGCTEDHPVAAVSRGGRHLPLAWILMTTYPTGKSDILYHIYSFEANVRPAKCFRSFKSSLSLPRPMEPGRVWKIQSPRVIAGHGGFQFRPALPHGASRNLTS